MTGIIEMLFDSVLTACFNDVGLLLLVGFVIFVAVMAKYKVPLVASVLIGIILLFTLGSIVAGPFMPMLAILILGGGIAAAFVFFKLGRS